MNNTTPQGQPKALSGLAVPTGSALRLKSLEVAANMPGDLIENAERVYLWLSRDEDNGSLPVGKVREIASRVIATRYVGRIARAALIRAFQEEGITITPNTKVTNSGAKKS